MPSHKMIGRMIQLTKSQVVQMKKEDAKVDAANKQGKPGMLLAQIFPTSQNMRVFFLDNKGGKKLEQIIRLIIMDME